VGRFSSLQSSNFPGWPTWLFAWEAPVDEVAHMREGVAKEYGIQLYRQYSEPEAAFFLGMDLSTLKRNRTKGTQFVKSTRMGERRIRYLGLHIVDAIIKGFGDE
jgi:hypothetical protein